MNIKATKRVCWVQRSIVLIFENKCWNFTEKTIMEER